MSSTMNHRRKPLRAVLLGVVCLGGMACAPAAPPEESRFSVRLLTSVTLSGRWERAAERGLGQIAAQLGADVARTRCQGSEDVRARLRALAERGTDLVFCVGPDVESQIYTESSAFPDTVFVVIPGEIYASNVASVTFLSEEAGYLAGAVAASVTDSSPVGLLRGAGRPWLEQLEAGFVAGFRSKSENAEVINGGGPEGPWTLTSAGVEIALYATDRVDPQVLAAAHDAGLLLVGADPSLLDSEPDLVLAAVDVDVADAMARIAREVHDRTFNGQIFAFDLGSGVLDVVLNPALAPPDRQTELREALERARSELTAGWVEIEELGIGL
jgi:basic membrane protein A